MFMQLMERAQDAHKTARKKGEGSSKGVSPLGLGAATAGPSASWDEAWDRLQGKERLREGAVRIKRTVAAEATPSTP